MTTSLPSDLGSGVKTRIYGIDDIFCQCANGAFTTPVNYAMGTGGLVSPKLEDCHYTFPGLLAFYTDIPSGGTDLGQPDQDLSPPWCDSGRGVNRNEGNMGMGYLKPASMYFRPQSAMATICKAKQLAFLPKYWRELISSI